MLRALWWRRWVVVSTLIVATIAVVAAAAGPLYLDAARESSLQATLRNATWPQAGVQITGSWNRVEFPEYFDPVDYMRKLLPSEPWLTAGVVSVTIAGEVSPRAALPPGATPQSPAAASLAYRDGECAHLAIVAGRCPTKAGEILVSTRSASARALRPGDTVDVTIRSGARAQAQKLPMRVVGLYTVPDDLTGAYWGSLPTAFDFNGLASGSVPSPTLDAVFIAQAELARFHRLQELAVQGAVRVVPRAIRTSDLAAVQGQLESYFVQTQAQNASVNVTTGLPVLFAKAKDETNNARATILVISGCLLVLALYVLYQTVAAALRARAREVALAKLRGLSTLGTFRFALLEPLILIVAAVPIGVFAARGLIAWAASATFLPGIPVRLTLGGWIAALVAFGGCLLAGLIGTRRVVRERLDVLLERVDLRARSGTGDIIADATIVALTAAALVALWFGGVFRGGRSNMLALVAPVLLCLAIAVVGARLLPFVYRVVLRGYRLSRRVAGFLALAQVLRRSGALRVMVVVTVAFGLATFAVVARQVGRRNDATWAQADVGADRVLTVTTPPDVDLERAVRAADPGGRAAMAVAQVHRLGGPDVLAVDSSRFAHVATWLKSYSAAPLPAMTRELTSPGTVAPVRFAGTWARLSVDVVALHPVDLTVRLVSNARAEQSVEFDGVTAGAHTLARRLPDVCRYGCTLTGVQVTWQSSPPPSERVSPSVTLHALATQSTAADVADPHAWHTVDAHFGNADAWLVPPTSNPVRAVNVSADHGATVIHFDPWSTLSVNGAIVANDVPAVVPGIITTSPPGLRDHDAHLLAPGLDGSLRPVEPVAHVAALPRLGKAGVIIEYAYAFRQSRAGNVAGVTGVTEQVWLSSHAGPDVIRRLAKQGVRVIGSQSVAGERTMLSHQGTALAFDAFLYAAVIAALLAAGSAVVTVFLDARRRSFEFAAMRSLNVKGHTLLLSSIGEQCLLLGGGAVLGLVGGLLSAWLTLPTIPEFLDQSAGVPLDYSLPGGAVALLVAGLASLVLVLAIGAGVVLMRGARPVLLRTVQE